MKKLVLVAVIISAIVLLTGCTDETKEYIEDLEYAEVDPKNNGEVGGADRPRD